MSIWGALKTWIIESPGHPGSGNDNPSVMSPIVQSWQSDLALVRAIYGGFGTLFADRRRFLPQHPKEDGQDYLIRASRPTFYNAFGRTVRSLTGSVFAKDPTPEGVPAEILKFFKDDIDNEGTAGPAFLRYCFNDALVTGLAGVFVDTPVLVVSGEAEPTRGDELDAEIRPFWKLVSMDDIVSFRPIVENGKVLLEHLVYREHVHQAIGKYGVKLVERLRDFRRVPAVQPATKAASVLWETLEKNDRGKWQPVADGELPAVTEIPLAQIYTERRGFMDACPPLLDLAYVNLLHYQTASDLAHAAHIANVPVLFIAGFDASDLQIGPNRCINAPTAKPDEVTARWLETTGASIGSTRAILGDLEEQMAHLGLGMLQRKSRAAETAEKASLDRKDQESTLGAAVSDLENGIEQALFWTAQYMGMESGGRLSFARDFESQPAAADRTENQGEPADPKDPKKPGETNNPKTTGA